MWSCIIRDLEFFNYYLDKICKLSIFSLKPLYSPVHQPKNRYVQAFNLRIITFGQFLNLAYLIRLNSPPQLLNFIFILLLTTINRLYIFFCLKFQISKWVYGKFTTLYPLPFVNFFLIASFYFFHHS